MRKYALVSGALIALSGVSAVAQNTDPNTILFADSSCPAILFSDEFPDTSKWTLGGGGPLSDGNGDFLSYQPSSPNPGVDTTSLGLKVSILPSNNTPNGAAWIAGLLNTQNTFSHAYGYWEAIVDISPGMLAPGMSWAFWLLGYHTEAGYGWPQEVDIAEFYGSTRGGALHNANNGNSAANYDYGVTPGEHTFSFNWQPDKMQWFMDNQIKKEVTTPSNFNQPMFIIIGSAATKASGWTSAPTPGASGSITVSRVRVYKDMASAKSCVNDISPPAIPTNPQNFVSSAMPPAANVIPTTSIDPTQVSPPSTSAPPSPSTTLSLQPSATSLDTPPSTSATPTDTTSQAPTIDQPAPVHRKHRRHRDAAQAAPQPSTAPQSTPAPQPPSSPSSPSDLLSLTQSAGAVLSQQEQALIQEYEALDRQSQDAVSKILDTLNSQGKTSN